ncbi:MAG: release factor glutamine methyltransferase [Pseudonocardiales bacterium]|nr:release factor glutamine methyltransferase [Pseudonocardiales bacterium]
MWGSVHTGARTAVRRVVADPPYIPARTQDPARYRIARCWDGGHDGRLLLDRLCSGLPDVLTADGCALIVHSEVCGEQSTIDAMTAVGLDARVVARARSPSVRSCGPGPPCSKSAA